ncbi:MAG TPA: sulfatase-like hydrolase/transferase [Candidatus Sulfopaludibacter sp.]|jgi:arylsulfatase A-like enzyme|nr:sulfatase-like hydrolase/transferase [Candidatus Sulfopaludibacter sp.]
MQTTRRNFLAASLASPLLTAADAPDRPNVLVIVLDDLGVHDMGFLGAADLKTPNIDALAGRGLKFRNWYSNAPVCAPARSAILTGRYPISAGVPDNGPPLAHNIPTIASVLKGASYRTGCFGKWHLGNTDETAPNGHGFDSFYGFHSGCVDYFSHRYYWGDNYHDLWRNRTEIFDDGRYLTERIADEAVDYIGRERGKPFFGYVAFNAPHYPMHAPEIYKARFPALSKERQTYAAMIAAVDDGVGRIRQALETAGAADNTLLFFIGDNGATTEKRAGLDGNYATAGDNGTFKGFKFSLFDGGMHVPGFVSWPARIRRGAWTDQMAMSMDILPTICRATGAALPDRVDGSDILNTLLNGAPSPHKSLYWSQGGQLATRRGNWKLVVNGKLYDRSPDGAKPLTGDDAVWLSNLDDDPGETRNLRRANATLVDELMTDLYRWRDGLRK